MSPTSSLDLVQFLMVKVYSRRLLLHTPLYKQPSDSASSLPASVSDSRASEGNLDANVVMILAVLLCALIVALGLNSIVRCALRCANRMALEPESSSVAARLALVGAKRKALKALPTLVYSAGMRISGTGSECTICLSDLAPGEQIRVLPKCNHGFHVRCIDRWLMTRSSCPTCRQCLVSAGQNVSGCAVASSSGPVQSIIMPLELFLIPCCADWRIPHQFLNSCRQSEITADL